MAFADQLAALLTHATAAGAAITPKVTDVAIGLPLPRGRCIRLFWDGEQLPVRMGGQRDLTGELVSDRITAALFMPVSTSSEAQYSQTLTEMYAFKHEMRTRVLGDSQLGGQSTDLEMEYAAPDFAVFGQALYAVVNCTFVLDFSEYPIAP